LNLHSKENDKNGQNVIIAGGAVGEWASYTTVTKGTKKYWKTNAQNDRKYRTGVHKKTKNKKMPVPSSKGKK
jgi:hypothetical protein